MQECCIFLVVQYFACNLARKLVNFPKQNGFLSRFLSAALSESFADFW